MRAAIVGNETAYRKLLEDLSRILRKLVRRELGGLGASGNDVEDVVHDILLAIHLKRHTWDSSMSLTSWVTAVARNKIIDNLRRQGRRPEVALDVSNAED
jgi:RNA polymerase sigma-70 factor (ECF subfamily)